MHVVLLQAALSRGQAMDISNTSSANLILACKCSVDFELLSPDAERSEACVTEIPHSMFVACTYIMQQIVQV